jgi:hypothetical protein
VVPAPPVGARRSGDRRRIGCGDLALVMHPWVGFRAVNERTPFQA